MRLVIFGMFYGAVAWASDPRPPSNARVHMKFGYSAVRAFNEAPTKAVLGSERFQVERLGKSVLMRPLVREGASNLILYFGESNPFVLELLASDVFIPISFEAIDYPLVKEAKPKPASRTGRIATQPRVGLEIELKEARFDKEKNYLNVSVVLRNHAYTLALPLWETAELRYKRLRFKTKKSWAKKRDLRLGDSVEARFEFVRPSVPERLDGVELVLPVQNSYPLKIRLSEKSRSLR